MPKKKKSDGQAIAASDSRKAAVTNGDGSYQGAPADADRPVSSPLGSSVVHSSRPTRTRRKKNVGIVGLPTVTVTVTNNPAPKPGTTTPK